MNLSATSDALSVHVFRWALRDFQREISHGYPFLGYISYGLVFRLLAWFEALSPKERGSVATALVKRFHPRAVELTGESLTPEEAAWLQECRRQIRLPTSRELALREAEISHPLG